MENKQVQLLELISALAKSTSEFLDSSHRVMTAANSKLYSLDLLVFQEEGLRHNEHIFF